MSDSAQAKKREHWKAPEPADVDCYQLSKDGGLIYNPISREARKAGELFDAPEGLVPSENSKYTNAETEKCVIETGGAVLTAWVPKNVTAYDAVPVRYKLNAGKAALPVHISVTAFEEPARTGAPAYDLNLPGRVDLDYSFQGYVGGQIIQNVRPKSSPDFKSDVPGKQYPPVKLTPLTYSGNMPLYDNIWFLFSYKNSGDTILDGNGNGSFQFELYLYKENDEGVFEKHAVPTNLYYRLFDDLYPGETGELYVAFNSFPGYPYKGYTPGRYLIELRGVVRSELKQPDFIRVVWSGTPFTVSRFTFTVEENAEISEPKPITKETQSFRGRNGWLNTYEEYLSSFKSLNNSEEGIIYVQPSPFTKQIAVKMMTGDRFDMQAAYIPVETESDSLFVRLNPNHTGYISKNGKRRPAVVSQMMADMRGNLQNTPFANEGIINDLLDMKNAGVNLMTSTIAFAMDAGNHGEKGSGAADAFKFGADVLRSLEIPLEGMICYPYSGGRQSAMAALITGEEPLTGAADGCADDRYTKINMEAAKYLFKKYGENYVSFGSIPFCAEDTRGWLRFDQHIRYPIGVSALERFREWLDGRYSKIEALNAAWGSKFNSFDEINPESDGGAGKFGHKYEYNDKAKVFHNYSPAMDDFDLFRSLDRHRQYSEILKGIRELVPDARICLRTEGSNWLVDGIPADCKNPKYRHVLFSQRLNGAIASVLRQDGVVGFHSDYITLPYTPSELSELTSASVEQGILPMLMNQYNRLRDVAINEKYGDGHYTSTYNLKTPAKAVFINTLTALYPCFKAIYEAGGIPGILWQDFLCDGYTTKTQYDEMLFFKKKIDEMLQTSDGRKWEASGGRDGAFRKSSLGRRSYPQEYIRGCVQAAKQSRSSKFIRKKDDNQ